MGQAPNRKDGRFFFFFLMVQIHMQIPHSAADVIRHSLFISLTFTWPSSSRPNEPRFLSDGPLLNFDERTLIALVVFITHVIAWFHSVCLHRVVC